MEIAVVKEYVMEIAVLTTKKLHVGMAISVVVCNIDVVYLSIWLIVAAIDHHRVRRIVASDVGNAHIVDIHASARAIGGLDEETICGTLDHDIGNGNVAYGTSADTYPECTYRAGKDTVAEAYVFAGAMFFQQAFMPAQGDCIVARVDIAVADHDILAAINVNAIGIGRVPWISDEELFCNHISASNEIT